MTGHLLSHVLLALLAIIALGRALGWVLRWLGQPRVIGEVLAGICLGPSLLGCVSPGAMHFLVPETIGPVLAVLAQLGVILYLFLIGLELNAGLLRRHAATTLTIAHTAIVVPFLLGVGLAFWLYAGLAPEGVPFLSFALFMGVALAITAFPVLARILTDQHREKTALGVLMNTRGLMELIVLNIGLDLGVISPTLFTMLVLMALATTLATTPLLWWAWPAPLRDPATCLKTLD
jgi:Kef-type K+ transport system membrane component KefB